MQFLFLLLFIFYPVVSVSAEGPQQQAKSIEQRLVELEEHKKVIEEWYASHYLDGKGRIMPYISDSILLGGFFQSSVTHMYGDDMKSQTATNSNGLGINLSAIFSDKIKFVTQTLTVLSVPLRNVYNNPSQPLFKQRQFAGLSVASTVTQGYLEISKNDAFNFQMGLGYVPFGYIFQQRELALFHKAGGPQMLGYPDSLNIGIATALWTGVHIYGQFPNLKERIGYNAYTFTAETKVTELGGGGRLWWAESDNLTMGVSVQAGPQRDDSHFITHGFDIDYRRGQYGVVAEYAYSDYSMGQLDAESYYVEPYMKFADGEWLAYVSTDYLSVPARLDPFTRAPDPIKIWEHSIGVNWLPIPNARIRLGYVRYDFVGETDTINGQKRDWNSIDFSAGIAF